MSLYFLLRRNGTEPIFQTPLFKVSSQLSCCSHSGRTEAPSAAQVPLGFEAAGSFCTQSVCAAFHCSARRSTTHLVAAQVIWPFYCDLCFFHTGVKWSVGRKQSLFPRHFKKNIYAHKARQHCAANTDCGSNLPSRYRCMDLNLV